MSQTESNSPTNTATPNSKPTTLHQQASSSSKQKKYKPIANPATDEAQKMSANNPIEIGTRGTVGALVMKEIEYFNQLELSSRGNDTQKPNRSHATHTLASSSSTNNAKPNSGSASTTQKKKKRGGGGGGNRLLPSMCSMVEVLDSNSSNNNRSVGVSGFGYRSLKADVKNLQA